MTDIISAAMAGTARVTANSAEDAQALIDHAAKANEAERGWAKLNAAENLPSINTASTASVTLSGGKMTARSGGAVSVQTPTRDVPKGMIRLANGMVTTLEAAEAAGFIIADEQRRGPVASSFNGAAPGALPETPQPTSQGTEQAPQGAPDGATLSVSQEDAAKITAGQEALKAAGEAIGNTAVNSMVQNVIATGELPAHLPSGVSADQVNAAVAGYVAEANAVLRETGANVAALTELLNDNELRDARVAVSRNDDARLQELGHRAMSRLQSLPDDPALFKQLTAAWGPEVQITRRNGNAFVKCPGWEMSWADAVKAGKIGF